MATIVYPFDPTGLAATNLITNEVHVLSEINAQSYRVFIPSFAPFYLDNFKLEYVQVSGAVRVLQENVDYYLCLPFIGATRSIGKVLYGGISINNAIVDGTLRLTYQTLGGQWVANPSAVLQNLSTQAYNPRITVWDLVTSVPGQFPPINHQQVATDIAGMEFLVNSINSLATTVATSANNTTPLVQHLTAANPHTQYALASDVAALQASVAAGGTGGATQLAAHIAAVDPHPQYTNTTELNAAINAGFTTHAAATDPHPQYTTDAEATTIANARATAAVTAHSALSDPHPQYATDADVASLQNQINTLGSAAANGLSVNDINNAITAHVNAADPHPVYTTNAEATTLANTAASTAIGTHTTAADPHPQYTTDAEATTIANASASTAVTTHTAAADPHPQYTTTAEATTVASSAVNTHTAAADPHPQYTTDAEATTIANAALATHNAAANPHPQYATTAQVNAANILTSSASLSNTNIPIGTLLIGFRGNNVTGLNIGQTCAGSEITVNTNAGAFNYASITLPGTWRCLSNIYNTAYLGTSYGKAVLQSGYLGLFVRIA